MKYVISVSKAYKHRGKHQHRTAKKHWFVYFYEFDEKWRMKSKQVNWLQAVYYMTKKHHRIKLYCSDCGSEFLALVKSKKEKLECPNCLEQN